MFFFLKIFVTTIWRHSHFLFIRSCNFNWNACVTSFFALIGASFLFIRVIKFLVTRDLQQSQKWLPHFEFNFYLLYFKEIRSSECVTLNGIYLRAADRGSNNFFFRFNQNITSQLSMKRVLIGVSTVFETADLRSYCGYFLTTAILNCSQTVCSVFSGPAICLFIPPFSCD